MNIRNKLYIDTLISITLVVILVSMTFITSNAIAEKSREHKIAHDMHFAVSELDIIMYEYLIYHEERMEQQWNLKYHAMAKNVGEKLATSIHAEYVAFGDLFSQVTRNHKKRERFIQEGASQKKIDVTTQLEKRLVAQLLIKSQSMITAAARFAEGAHAELMEAQELANNLSLILMIILAVVVLTTLLLVVRSISKPLDELTKGVEIVGKGNLDYRIDIKTKDEIGELGSTFNRMTQNLKKVTSSRDELKKEIAKRKKVEEAIQESEKRYRLLVESITDGIQVHDRDLRYLMVNDELVRMAGMPREKLIGKKMTEVFPGVEKTVFFKIYQKVLETGEPAVASNKFIFPDGRTTWFEVHAYPAPQGILVIVTNITERKKTEDALKNSEARLRSVIESEMIGILFWDTNGDITDANDTFLQMVGYTKDEVLSEKVRWRDMTPPEYKEQDDKALEEVATTGAMTVIEKEYIRKDGNRIPILLGAASLPGPGLNGVAFVLDITDRKRAQEEMAKGKMFLDCSLSSAPDGVFLIDKQAIFTYANPTFLKMIGYEEKEIVGKTIQEIVPKIVPPGSAKIIQERAKKRLETGEPIIGVELELLNKKGTTIPIAYSASGIKDEQGNVIGEVVFLRDITTRKQAEERLKTLNEHLKQRTLDLERSNKELEQFAYVASHDLQEPLRMVASYTQLLEKRYKDQLDADAREFINFAVDGANRMQKLINDLLTYSRLGTKGKPFELIDCHLVLGKVLANLSTIIEKSHAMIANDDLPVVVADEGQLVQLFQNLISNAIKFHSKEQSRIHVSAKEKNDEWIFSIRDNSIGIESEFKDRIFVIFQRLHSKDLYPGTGMGLAICKKIVERHGGRIWFDSTPNKGSTFFFTIPKKEE